MLISTSSPEPLCYSIKQAQRALGVSRPTVMNLISLGRLRATRIERKLLVNRASLEAFAAGQPEVSA
jgi:excisionase family DNA binding protein